MHTVYLFTILALNLAAVSFTHLTSVTQSNESTSATAEAILAGTAIR